MGDAPAVPFDLPSDQLHGKVAVITGASRGLGAGMAARLAEHGVQLGLCARTEPTPPPGARCLTGAVDVTDAAALDRFASAVASSLGPIDLWINNAGVLAPMGPLRGQDPAAVDLALRVNVGGVANGSRSFVERCRGWQDSRRVLVNVSSGAATSIYEGWSIYGATKAAVDHLTEIVAAEEPGVLCHAVAPGVVDTDMQAEIRTHDERTFPAIDRFRQLHAEGAWNTPAWVADHVLGLLAGTWTPETVVVRVPSEPR
jgi:NAD(P)-dependent dehydrogenase (short-subunit alcohol dehydrogenase family)